MLFIESILVTKQRDLVQEKWQGGLIQDGKWQVEWLQKNMKFDFIFFDFCYK